MVRRESPQPQSLAKQFFQNFKRCRFVSLLLSLCFTLHTEISHVIHTYTFQPCLRLPVVLFPENLMIKTKNATPRLSKRATSGVADVLPLIALTSNTAIGTLAEAFL